MFEIDLTRYNLIDISYTVIPGEDTDRPFAIQKALLQDRSFRYDILKTHTHVGTHVEVGKHFYEGGKSITDYPLNRFFGTAILFPVTEMEITAELCEKAIGPLIREGDIIILRNDTGVLGTKQETYAEGKKSLPWITPEAAKWLALKKPKLLVLDFIKYGRNIEEIRFFHDILMRDDVVFVEFVANLDKINQNRFFVMALPYKVQNLDSSFVRAIVIEEK